MNDDAPSVDAFLLSIKRRVAAAEDLAAVMASAATESDRALGNAAETLRQAMDYLGADIEAYRGRRPAPT